MVLFKKLLLLLPIAGLLVACEPDPDPQPNPGGNDTTYHPGEIPHYPGPKHDTVFEIGGKQFIMRYVPGGTFYMGASGEASSQHRDIDAMADEAPVHTVTLSPYLISETEVSQAVYLAVMGYNPSQTTGLFLPVTNVSYTNATRFVEHLAKYLGFDFRLPTEAEWEYAARGGNNSPDYRFSGNDTADNVAWYAENSEGNVHICKSKQANELGLYDMSGNVMEWCSDWYGAYPSYHQTNPQGVDKPELGYQQKRVVRGGSFHDLPFYLRNTVRQSRFASYEDNDIGLRIVLPCE